jgi:hypothetical protein
MTAAARPVIIMIQSYDLNIIMIQSYDLNIDKLAGYSVGTSAMYAKYLFLGGALTRHLY